MPIFYEFYKRFSPYGGKLLDKDKLLSTLAMA
jgi:hypothetical protein